MLHDRKLCSGSRTSEQSFVSLYDACSVSIDNKFDINMWNVVYTLERKRFTIDCLCVLLVVVGVKCRSWAYRSVTYRTVKEYGRNQGKLTCWNSYKIDENSCWILSSLTPTFVITFSVSVLYFVWNIGRNQGTNPKAQWWRPIVSVVGYNRNVCQPGCHVWNSAVTEAVIPHETSVESVMLESPVEYIVDVVIGI
jgi:hypothetical protein